MASIYLRGTIYWVKLGHPDGGRQVSFSLETPDQARAVLLAQVAQARFNLRRPVLRDLQLPDRILEFLGDSSAPSGRAGSFARHRRCRTCPCADHEGPC